MIRQTWFSVLYHIYNLYSIALATVEKVATLRQAECQCGSTYPVFCCKEKQYDIWSDFYGKHKLKNNYSVCYISFRCCIYKKILGQKQLSTCWLRIHVFHPLKKGKHLISHSSWNFTCIFLKMLKQASTKLWFRVNLEDKNSTTL